MLNMYEVKDKNKTYLFSNKTDADNYIDYLQHGLKCISQKDRTYCFNNGARLIDVSLYGTNNEKFVLHYNNKCIVSKTLQKKYIKVLGGTNYEHEEKIINYLNYNIAIHCTLFNSRGNDNFAIWILHS
jgi:hypothetical protein